MPLSVSLSLSLSHLFCPFLKSHSGIGEEKEEEKEEEKSRGGKESESACRAGEIVLIKEASAPCEKSLVGQRLNRLLQKGTMLVVVVVVQLQDPMGAIISKGRMDGGSGNQSKVERGAPTEKTNGGSEVVEVEK